MTFADPNSGVACNDSRKRAMEFIGQLLIDLGMTSVIGYFYKHVVTSKLDKKGSSLRDT